jgi:Tfp pilus assembly protein PilX
MINLFRKLMHSKHRGAATILITLILLSVSTLIVLFAANYGVMQQKVSTNAYRYYQAYEAAEAGLEFAIPYLQQNKATILAGPVGGYIPAYSDSSTANVTLGNNSRYTIVYSNPIANNYDLIKITVTGTSDDGTSSQVISQLVQFDSFLSSTPSSPLTAKGAVTLKGTK